MPTESSDLSRVYDIERDLGVEASDRTMLTTGYCAQLQTAGWQVRSVSNQHAYHEVLLARDTDIMLHVSQDYAPKSRRAIRVSPVIRMGGVDVISSTARVHGRAGENKPATWLAPVSPEDLEVEVSALDRMIVEASIYRRVLGRELSDETRRVIALGISASVYRELGVSQQQMIAAQLFSTSDWEWHHLDGGSALRNAISNLREGGLKRHTDGKQPTRRVSGLLRRTEISRLAWREFESCLCG